MPATPRTALITGASTGIGYELSKIFAREHYQLVLVARNEQKLQEIDKELSQSAGISVKVIAKDLSNPSAADELFALLQQQSIDVDVLVNNAGFATYGPFAESDPHAQIEMMNLNMVTLTHLTRLVLPAMIQRHDGKIMNVASTAAFQPGPLMAVYYATKAYVLFFSEALNNELEGTGVTVSALCPGPTTTDFQKRARMDGVRLVRSGLMDAATVAEAGYQGLMKDKPVVIPGFKNSFLAFTVRFMPRNMVVRITRKLQSRD